MYLTVIACAVHRFYFTSVARASRGAGVTDDFKIYVLKYVEVEVCTVYFVLAVVLANSYTVYC